MITKRSLRQRVTGADNRGVVAVKSSVSRVRRSNAIVTQAASPHFAASNKPTGSVAQTASRQRSTKRKATKATPATNQSAKRPKRAAENNEPLERNIANAAQLVDKENDRDSDGDDDDEESWEEVAVSAGDDTCNVVASNYDILT